MVYDVVRFGSRYGVIELSSGLVLKINKRESAARTLQRKLEAGTAFEGNTPPFFSNSISSEYRL